MSKQQNKLKISEIESIVKNAMGNQFVSMWKQTGTNDYMFTVSGNVEQAAQTIENCGFSVMALYRPKSMEIAKKTNKIVATFDYVSMTKYVKQIKSFA